MTAPELKPCPFCGADAERIDIGNDECGNAGGSVIQCAKCMASSRVEFGFKENLIDAWNRRADLAAVRPAQVRVLALEFKINFGEEHLRASAKSVIGTYNIFPITGYMNSEEKEFWLYIDGEDSQVHYQTIDTAKAAAQADYESRILAALEPHPDPRDDVIARLVDAASVTLHDIDDLVANSSGVAGLHMNGDIADWETILDGGTFGAWLSSVENLRAALAAEKAVMK